MSKVKEKKDVDYAEQAVPEEGRKGFVTMFMIMLGFTFFSASMWVGQQLAAGENFWEFLGSLILGGCILGLYTGLLGYVGAKTGLSMDLLARKAFLRYDQFYPDRLVWRRCGHVCHSGCQSVLR